MKLKRIQLKEFLKIQKYFLFKKQKNNTFLYLII